jgi:hypothetical protein
VAFKDTVKNGFIALARSTAAVISVYYVDKLMGDGHMPMWVLPSLWVVTFGLFLIAGILEDIHAYMKAQESRRGA